MRAVIIDKINNDLLLALETEIVIVQWVSYHRAVMTSSRLDYCNSLLSDYLLRKRQTVQNASACLVTGSRRRDYVTPVLRQMRRLPHHQTVESSSILSVSSIRNCRPNTEVSSWWHSCRLRRSLSAT